MRPDVQRVSEALKRLFRTYPGFQTDDVAATMQVYFEAVQPYATEDIEAAVTNFLTGSAPGHNPSFAPSAPLLGAEARRVMNLRVESEARERRYHPQLPAPDIEHTPESRARVAAMTANLLANLKPQKMDAASDKEYWAGTHEMFAPDPSEAALRRRLGYSAGDPDGDREVA